MVKLGVDLSSLLTLSMSLTIPSKVYVQGTYLKTTLSKIA